MNIERDEKTRFPELGTLISVTRRIGTHDEALEQMAAKGLLKTNPGLW